MIPLAYARLLLLLLLGDQVCSLSSSSSSSSAAADPRARPTSDKGKSLWNAGEAKQGEEFTPSRVFPNGNAVAEDRANDFTTARLNKRDVDVPTETYPRLRYSEYDNTPQSSEDYSSSSTAEAEAGDTEEPEGPPDHVIPFSEHEDPREPPTRPNYTAPGVWAKPPADRNISLEFVPLKMYTQVRGTHTVKRLPRAEAFRSAGTEEEKENAARLKEVVNISKSNTVYSEEGYEDAAYDHAGQIRDAKFHEGYNKKLNENSKRKKIDPDGEGLGSVNIKALETRKSKPRGLNKHDLGDVTESIQEARLSAQKVIPKDSQALKGISNESVVDPKAIVEDSILQLERDLKKVSYEKEATSTESHHVGTTTYLPPVTEPLYRNKIEYETTTLEPVIYTIRTRKSTMSALPKTKPRSRTRPSTYRSDIDKQENSNNEDRSSNRYKSKPQNNENLPWRYDRAKEKPVKEYSPDYYESQTTNPVIANPLAVATVNGHGPYLLVVTEQPNNFTPRALQSEASTTTPTTTTRTTRNYVSTPRSRASILEHNPFFQADNRRIKTRERNQDLESRMERPKAYKGKKVSEKNLKLQKPSSNHAKVLEYLRNEDKNYYDYYTLMPPPSEPSYALLAYPDNLREPYDNVREHWPVARESERPRESERGMRGTGQRSRTSIGTPAQESSVPVSRLLPPAPLSTSEYSSFRAQQGRTSEPMIGPSVVSIVPIIAAIHRHKSGRGPVPFFRRKKRSLGPSREWQIEQRDRRLQKAALAQARKSLASEADEDKATIQNYPSDFEDTLNEAPNVASREINAEISDRFRNASRDEADETSEEDPSHESGDTVNKDLEEGARGGEGENDDQSSTEKYPVKVAVPELDFDSAFEEDEVEPSTVPPRIDVNKYPYYGNSKILKSSALKYIVNPLEVPKKTFGGMEFYDSRNLECEEIDPSLEKLVPEEEELANKRGPRRGKNKLRGLGNKIDCYKAKYFDRNPLDNPLFLEETIELPSAPIELDPKRFASRISDLSPEREEYIISRGPKYPEDFTLTKEPGKSKKPSNHHYADESKDDDPRLEITNSRNNYSGRRRPSDSIVRNKSRARPNKLRSKSNLKRNKIHRAPAYQRQVYEDVMGTIMNLENMHETPIPVQNIPPVHTLHRAPDFNNNKRENSEFDKPKKQRQMKIEGLIPPPQYVFNTMPISYMLPRSNWRNARIFKRSAEIQNINEVNNTDLNHTNHKKLIQKNTFRIVMTTPIPEKLKRKRKAVKILPDETTTQRPIYTINDRLKSVNRSTEEIGRFGKFTNKTNPSSAIDPRRKEPRYNVSKRENVLINDTNLTTSNPIENTISTISSQSSTDPTLSRSNLIPVIVKPDANFTVRIPEESKTQYMKQKLESINNDDEEIKLSEYADNIDETSEKAKNTEKPSSEYLVHESTQEAGNEKNDELENEFTVEPDSQEHQELVEFLKGDPPGYKKTFKHETTPEYDEIKPHESMQSTKSKKINLNERMDGEEEEQKAELSGEEESSKETFAGGNTSDNSEEEPKENDRSDKEEEENTSTSSQKAESEPFTRFSSRPNSPSENYEDEHYSELGSRINKPYFYHPPFDVPEYEKYVLGKSVDQANEDDWNHSEETEDHETYVFPWEQDKDGDVDDDDDDDVEKDDESRNYSYLGKYEYPWERRERKRKERRIKAKLQKKYGKNFLSSHEDQYEEEEATNTKPIYVHSRKKHSRNKKDVNNVKNSSDHQPIIKFSSKYQSKIIKDPINDDKMLATITKSDKIGTIINYFENTTSSTPNIKSSHTSHKSILNDTYSLNTTTDLPNKTNNILGQIENATSKSPSILTKAKSSRTGKSNTGSSVTSTTAKPHTRIRSRRITNKTNSTSESDNVDKKVSRGNSGAQNSQLVRRRGRSKDNTNMSKSLTTTTKAPIKSKSRKRSRATVISVTPSVTAVTSKTVSERRRRPLTVKSNTIKGGKISKIGNNTSTTLPSISTSTVRTIEHHSRLSKEEIITKTFYPDSAEEEDEDEDLEENSSNQSKEKRTSDKRVENVLKIKRRGKPKNESMEEPARKKESVEKVTITMEETPNHVYRTKEIDKDGVKGKFVTITANNNSTTLSKGKDGIRMGDAEMEEMKRRMNAFSSFDSIKQDTEDLVDEPSETDGAEVSPPPRRHRAVRVSTRGYKHTVTSAISWESEGEHYF
jgi:hypothetical protein